MAKDESWMSFWYFSIQFLAIIMALPWGTELILCCLDKLLPWSLPICVGSNRLCSKGVPELHLANLSSVVPDSHSMHFIEAFLQREVLDELGEGFYFKWIIFPQQLVCHFHVSLVPVGELDCVDWTVAVVHSCAVVADESVWGKVLVHLLCYKKAIE